MNYPKSNTDGLEPFGTLEKINNIKTDDRWYPTAVQRLELLFGRGLLENIPKDLKKNMVYSLQNLEYLQLQLDELNVSSVIAVMIHKNYIITSMSIIEGLFHFILKSTGNWRTTEWELVKTVKNNPINCFGEIIRIENVVYKKVDKMDESMDFASMIKKIESKNLLDISHSAFPYIKKMKKIRNKVHLQINDYLGDNDWNSIEYLDYLWMKYILYTILTNKKFDNEGVKHLLNNIRPTKEEINVLSDDVEKRNENESKEV